jgi:hypothetical protein
VAVVLALAAASSVKVPQTPAEYAQHLRQAEIRRLVTKVGAGETAVSSSAVQVLKGITHDHGNPDHAFTMELIDKRFKEVEKRIFGKTFVGNRDNRSNIQAIREQQRKAIQSVAPYAELGSSKAKEWMVVLKPSGLVQTVALVY